MRSTTSQDRPADPRPVRNGTPAAQAPAVAVRDVLNACAAATAVSTPPSADDTTPPGDDSGDDGTAAAERLDPAA